METEISNAPASRLFHLAFLFFILILTSAYTANMAAFFTKVSTIVEGPSTLQHVRDGTGCNMWGNWAYSEAFLQNVGTLVGPNIMASGQTVEEGMLECERMLMAGEVDYVMDTEQMIQERVLRNCDSLAMQSNLRFAPASLAIALPKDPYHEELARNISIALTYFQSTRPYIDLLQRDFLHGRTCPSKVVSDT